jgi:uncharacterized protein
MTPDETLLVFAREPVPGLVKTRLIPALGASGAARLYSALLERAVNAATGVPGVAVELWCAGAPPSGGVCAELARRHGLVLRHQGVGNLGKRMVQALGETLLRCDRVVLIGSDCPGYHPAYLAAAFVALGGHDAVVGPAADGGYVLIGLRRPAPDLFADIAWGTDTVLAATRTALTRLGWTWAELPIRQDIDRPEDLAACPNIFRPTHPD